MAILGKEPLHWEALRLTVGMPVGSDVVLQQSGEEPGAGVELLEDKGFPERVPSCRGRFSRSAGQEAQVLVHCWSWQLEVPGAVFTVGAQLHYP